MANVLNFNANSYYLFFLVFLRISGLFITAPVLSSENVPRVLRVYMTIICSLIVLNVVPATNVDFSGMSTMDYFLLVLKELMIGLLLGAIPKVMFAAVNFAGTIVGFQMGLSIANVVDPLTDQQISVIASFEGLLATLLFVVLDGHHIFFEVLSISYQNVPIGSFVFTPGKIEFLMRIMGDLVIIGLQLGAPLVMALLLANVIMGFMARSIPQMNVFVVGFPFTIGLGLIFFIIGMPHLVRAISNLFDTAGGQIIEMLRIMAK